MLLFLLQLLISQVLISTVIPDPHLIFFNELQENQVAGFFDNNTLISNLQMLNATVAVGTIDLSYNRAQAINILCSNNISIVLCILVPWNLGYWDNMDNYNIVVNKRFQNIQIWLANYSISEKNCIDGYGLDLEFDTRDFIDIQQRSMCCHISFIFHVLTAFNVGSMLVQCWFNVGLITVCNAS